MDKSRSSPRSVVVSGASSGIGWATARRFAEAGDRVVNLDLRPPEDGPPGTRWIACDVTDWKSVAAALDEVEARQGTPEVVIANAGISIRHSIAELREEDARRVIDINFFGVLGLWKLAARQMLAKGRGVLLATASTNGSVGYPFYADYNASKAAVLALCRSFALEFAPVLRTACVSPGYVMTPMQRAEYSEDMIERVNRRIPLRRHASPEEIAGAFYFLASDDARFITGQTLVVDGGELAGGTASEHGFNS